MSEASARYLLARDRDSFMWGLGEPGEPPLPGGLLELIIERLDLVNAPSLKIYISRVFDISRLFHAVPMRSTFDVLVFCLSLRVLLGPRHCTSS